MRTTMDQLAIAFGPCSVDVAACDYDAVRAAFQHTLGLCTKKLVHADMQPPTFWDATSAPT